MVVFLETQVALFLYKKTFVGRTYTTSDNIYQMDNLNYTEAFPSIKTSDIIQYDAITVLKFETEMFNIVSKTS